MPRLAYKAHTFKPATERVIDRANQIIEEYRAQGFALTLRQLYYQFVARGMIENTQRAYKRLGDVINNARLAGLIDWYAIEDRTRFLRKRSTWESPKDIVSSAAAQFRMDRWRGQFYRPEVWIEKDALVGVIEGVCNELDVPYTACRGYTSQSEQWRAGRRFGRLIAEGQSPVVIYLGDHDPSGLDMTRDHEDRLLLFAEQSIHVERLALNMDQVEAHNPPPNPAKITDSRAADYIAQFGRESWELDALDPNVIADLLRAKIGEFLDPDKREAVLFEEEQERERLTKLVDNWFDVCEHIDQLPEEDD